MESRKEGIEVCEDNMKMKLTVIDSEVCTQIEAIVR